MKRRGTCPECQVDLDAPTADIRARVPRTLHAELLQEAKENGITLKHLVALKVAEPLDKKRICRACADRPKSNQSRFAGHRKRSA